jgi:hypothetical protein
MIPSIEDAHATLRHAIIKGLSEHANITGMQSGPKTDIIIKDLEKSLLDQSTIWALKMLADL